MIDETANRRSYARSPLTGEEYLDSLRDGRTVFVNGESVDDVPRTRPSATRREWWRGCTTRCTIPRCAIL